MRFFDVFDPKSRFEIVFRVADLPCVPRRAVAAIVDRRIRFRRGIHRHRDGPKVDDSSRFYVAPTESNEIASDTCREGAVSAVSRKEINVHSG